MEPLMTEPWFDGYVVVYSSSIQDDDERINLSSLHVVLSVAGHSCIDACKKMAAQHYNPMELIPLVGIADALLLLALVWDKFGSLFEMQYENLLRIIVINAGMKVMAEYMYQRALQVSPISVTVPYLAFTLVMSIFTSYFVMSERPGLRGLIGVSILTVGGYLLVIHSKDLTDTNKASLRISSTQILEPLLALKREEGSLIMLGVVGLFSISNSLDKMGTHVSTICLVCSSLMSYYGNTSSLLSYSNKSKVF